MALVTKLVVACPLNPVQLMKRALGLEKLTPTPEILPNGTLVLDYSDQGFVIRSFAGTRGYVEASLDSGVWVWEPPAFVHLGFNIDKEFELSASRLNMLRIVARVIASGGEDLALIENGQTCILRRLDGKLERFAAEGFWETTDPSQLPSELSS